MNRVTNAGTRARAPVAQRMLDCLAWDGPQTGPSLAARLGISTATVSRHLRGLGAAVLTEGSARATLHAARRAIPALPDEVPVYEVGPSGTVKLGALRPVEPRGFYFGGATPEARTITGFYPDLPWFLNDARPNGFLGRLVPLQHPEAHLPSNILLWSGDHVLRYLQAYGTDIVGNLIAGDPAFAAFLTAPNVNLVAAGERAVRYPELAAAIAAGGVPGSSAGGEQPKFVATRLDEGAETPVLVKFSPPTSSAVGRRVADLLLLEHLALQTVAGAGIPAAFSTVIDTGDRVFLEVERFDRVGPRGRRGVVSLATLDDQFVGSRESWTRTAVLLAQQGRVPETVVSSVRWLDRFGAFIANTDRHHGNLSCYFERGRIGGLTPVYDMLPMLYAPVHHEIVAKRFVAPVLDGEEPEIWRSSLRAALEFWTAAARLGSVEEGMRGIAAQNARMLARMGVEWLPA